jgi:hypothetical protein
MQAATDRETSHICPAIVSGGAGTRLWSLLRRLRPKRFRSLGTGGSAFQEAVLRVADPDRFDPAPVVCNEEQRLLVAERLRGIAVALRAILLEPSAQACDLGGTFFAWHMDGAAGRSACAHSSGTWGTGRQIVR